MASEVKKRLEEIEARVDKAVPGPWVCWGGSTGSVSVGVDHPYEITESRPGADAGSNYIFIAHARQDVPWLCARLRDALVVIEAWEPSVLSWCQRVPQAPLAEASAAYRRLFGEEESRG